jgi:hypothetical protein
MRVFYNTYEGKKTKELPDKPEGLNKKGLWELTQGLYLFLPILEEEMDLSNKENAAAFKTLKAYHNKCVSIFRLKFGEEFVKGNNLCYDKYEKRKLRKAKKKARRKVKQRKKQALHARSIPRQGVNQEGSNTQGCSA